MKFAPRRSLSSVRQRGAIAVVTAVVMISIAVPLMALLVNAGQLYYAQRDLQKLATLAAFDASRAESGCFASGAGVPGTLAAATAAVANTLAVNNAGSDGITPTVVFGKYDNTKVAGRRVFTQLAATDPGVDSVQVTLVRPQPATLVPWFTSSGTLTATAAAEHAPVASFLLGTTLLSIDSTKSTVLNALLPALLGSGSALSLSVVSYQGLASANVTASALATQLGINLAGANASDFLNTSFAIGGANGLLSALANAVGATGNAVAETALSQIQAAASPGRTVTLGQVLGVESGAENLIGDLPLNAMGLTLAIAQNAGGSFYPITISNLGINLGAVNVSTSLTIGQVAQQAAGRPGYVGGVARTSAKSAQITLSLLATVTAGSLAKIGVKVDATVASATAALASIRCPMGVGALASTKATVGVDVATKLASVTVGAPSGTSLVVTNLGGIAGLTVDMSPITVSPVAASSGTLSFTGPSFTPQTLGSAVDLGGTVGGVSLGSITVCAKILLVTVCLPLNSPLLNVALAPIKTAVGLLLSALDTVLNDLLAALGIEVGSATVTIEGVSYGNVAGRDSATSGSVPALYNEQKAGETAGTH